MTCSNRYRKSTLNAYNSDNQTITTSGLVSFPNFNRTGCSIDFTGGTSIAIDKPGLYQITFNGTVESSGTSGNVVVQLFKNGVLVPGAVSEAQLTSATDIENVAFSTIVEIPPSCNCVNNDATLTVVNTGVEAVLNNANVTVVKLC